MRLDQTMMKAAGIGMACLLLAACGTSKGTRGSFGMPQDSALLQAQAAAAAQEPQLDTKRAYFDLIVQMQQAGQWYASLAHVEAFVREHGESPDIALLRADALRNTQQYELAQQRYLQLMATPQVAARAHRGIGLLHAAQGRYGQAAAALEQARLLNPIDANVLSDLAYAYMQAGQLSAARMPAMQAAQLAPQNPRIQMNLALWLMATGERERAQQLLQGLSKDGTGVAAGRAGAVLQQLSQQAAQVQAAAHAFSTVSPQIEPAALAQGQSLTAGDGKAPSAARDTTSKEMRQVPAGAVINLSRLAQDDVLASVTPSKESP